MLRSLFLAGVIIWYTGCGGGNSSDTGESTPDTLPSPVTDTSLYLPASKTSFSIILERELPADITAEVIDLDAFETTKEQVGALHAAGKKVVAYVSVGSWEPYRDDADMFPADIIGNVYPGWEDERFLNIKALDTLLPLIENRFDMIAAKGFDGIEADNIDIYGLDEDGANGTGFHISLEDTKTYVRHLIDAAHARGLSIGQKNAPELVDGYGDMFDWALLEDPFFEGYAAQFAPYSTHDKAVFAISYTDNTSEETFLQEYCNQADILGFTALLKHRNLDSYELTCPK